MEQQAAVVVSRATLVEELRGILVFLTEQNKTGIRLRLSDVSGQMGRRLSLDFADYFKFLKRYNYVVINRRDHALTATAEGRRVAREGAVGGFAKEIQQFFARNIAEGDLISDEILSASEQPNGSKEERERSVEKERKPDPSLPVSVPVAKAPEGTKLDGQYTRYDSLGSGGIGTVYRGRLNSLAMEVAIKEIKDLFSFFNFLQRSEVMRHFREVVGRMALLNHPSIVRIHDQNTEVAHPYFVMEYMPQGNLRKLMDAGRLDIDKVLVLFVQMCYGLRAAHGQQVVHGNLKPENVLFDAYGNLRLSDFGMTRLLESDSKKAVPRVVTGSLGYLSPEQMQASAELSFASDIYTLGILLYEMLTGNLPGRRSKLPSEVRKDVPKPIDELFDRMTRDLPGDRYPDIDALLEDFYRAFQDGQYLSRGRLILFAEALPLPAEDSAEADAAEPEPEEQAP